MMIEFREVLDDAAIAVVERLAREIWTEHFTDIIGMSQVVYMLREFQSAAAIRKFIDQGGVYYLVRVEGRDAGYLAVIERPREKELFLSKFYLLSHYRGRGIGRRMMDFVAGAALQRGAGKISLNTNKKNLKTIAFYEKHGFIKARSDVADLGGGFVADDWRMEMVVPV